MQLLVELRLTLLAPLHLQPLHQGLNGQALKDSLTNSGARQDRQPPRPPGSSRSLLPLYTVQGPRNPLALPPSPCAVDV